MSLPLCEKAEETDPTVEPTDTTAPAEDTAEEGSTTAQSENKRGCGSTIRIGVVVLLAAAAVCGCKGGKEDGESIPAPGPTDT